MMSASNRSRGLARTGDKKPLLFRLSMSFLNRKKKSSTYFENDCSGSGPGYSDPRGCGLSQEEIAERNEDYLYVNGADLTHKKYREAPEHAENIGEQYEEHLYDNGAALTRKKSLGEPEHPDEDIEKLALAVISEPVFPRQLHKDSSIVTVPVSYKSYDIAYPPIVSPGKKTERSSSIKAFNPSTRSSSLRMESTTQKSTGALSKGWLSKRCGFKSCSKQMDMEAELMSRDGLRHGERLSRRAQRSRSKSMGPTPSERENGWGTITNTESDLARKHVVCRKKQASRLAPAPGSAPNLALHVVKSGIKCSLADACDEVREAARYELPVQRSDLQKFAEMDSSGENQMPDTSTNVDGNVGEDRVHPWDRSFSSSSSNDELFTTSFELDGQCKSRRKEWSSNSSDETESRHRRTGGSHARSKSTRSYPSSRSVEQENDIVENRKMKGKKGSRIIFLSTPPRPKELGSDDDGVRAPIQLVHNSTINCFGDSCISEANKDSRFAKTLPAGYMASRAPAICEADMEATAKAWSKLDMRSCRAEDSVSDVSVRELPMVSGSDGLGKQRLRHIGVQVEDQLVKLMLESDVSYSSEDKIYNPSLDSTRYRKVAHKFLDPDRPAKKKRGTHGRRKRGRRNRAPPPPLPSDLHGKVKESVAVVKSSYDPYTDFRDSMVEMIVEKEIQGATDLEELLRCYLSLNSTEYHSVIVKVFADVWRQLFADAF